MCNLYIETSDLDKAFETVDMALACLAILDLHSDKLTEFAQLHAEGAEHIDIESHTKFLIVTGIAIGLKLAETQLTLDTSL